MFTEDLNTLYAEGVYTISGAINQPENTGHWAEVLVYKTNNNDAIIQFCLEHINKRLFYRFGNFSKKTWDNWIQL